MAYYSRTKSPSKLVIKKPGLIISNSGNALMLYKHERPSEANSNSRNNKTPYTLPTMLKSHALFA